MRPKSALGSTRSTSIFGLCLAFAALLLAPAARAQWETVTYNLHGGWNAIYLHGDATYATPDVLFPVSPPITGTHPVQEVWRWNPNPTQTQFQNSPLIPSAGTSDWSVWTRGATSGNTLANLTGQTAYLIRCDGLATDNITVSLKQKVIPPRATWVRNGANLLGFPSGLGSTYPFFPTYFATFPAAIAANTRIYKYVGGELGTNNPSLVFSPAADTVDRNQAYWFESPLVGTFYGPLELSPSNLDGLTFGRTGSVIAVRVRNRTTSAMTLTIAPVDSGAAPDGQPQITGRVPLTRRVFNAGTNTTTETPITTAYTEVIGPTSSLTLEFGIDRAQMTGSAGALYASMLRFTDDAHLTDISLPASALVATLAGLWVGDIAVTNVLSKAPGSPGSTTSRAAPLRTLLHLDDAGTARLLSQVFVGKLDVPQNPLGLCTRESDLLASAKATASRMVAVHLPLDTELATGSGSVALGSSLTRTIVIPFTDRTNPFVHTYHPDHDNKDARGQSLPEGVESYTITRVCTFNFAATPPVGTSSVGWGTSVLGGTYTETITGLHRDPRPSTSEVPLTVTGSFLIRRVSEIGAITHH